MAETKTTISLSGKPPQSIILAVAITGVLMAGKDDIVQLILEMPISNEALKAQIANWVSWLLKVSTWIFGVLAVILGKKTTNPLT